MTGSTESCHYCGDAKPRPDLRPYGPGGEMVCFPCAQATPERVEVTERAMAALLEASAAASPLGIAAVTDDGYEPFVGRSDD